MNKTLTDSPTFDVLQRVVRVAFGVVAGANFERGRTAFGFFWLALALAGAVLDSRNMRLRRAKEAEAAKGDATA